MRAAAGILGAVPPERAGYDALSPRTAIDPATGDLHVLFRVGDAGRLTHARVPAW